MLEYDGTEYELKYNIKRIEMIENATGMPVLADIQKTGGMLSISTLKNYVAYGIKEAGSDAFLPTKKGMELAEDMILNLGYEEVCAAVLEELMNDCPFYFPES